MKKKLMSMILAILLVSSNTALFAEEQMAGNSIATNSIQSNRIEEDVFVLTINQKKYTKNTMSGTLTAAPINIDGRSYLPLRFAATQVLEGNLNWDAATQTATIATGTTTLIAKVNNKNITINGKQVTQDATVVIKNGTAYVPIKFINEYFGLSTKYDSKNQQITIIGKDKGVNNKPIAGFNFSASSYTEGQIVATTSTSYDPDGHQLAGKEWCLMKEDQTLVNSELSAIFNKPKAGTYTVGLRVKDQYGLWSDWNYKEIIILPNEAPVITYLGTEKNSYAQGEKIKYQYYYENESWEDVVNEKWTYRHADEDRSKEILGRPDALFTAGDYIIALQVDDAYGNRSEVYETTIHITEEVLVEELSYRFTYGKIGDMIDNYQGFNYREYKDAEITKTWVTPGTMIMSDSPEEVSREGILYRDVINGKGRLLIHHINQFSDRSLASGNKRLVVVAENTSSEPVTLTIGNKTIKGPSTDIVGVGQKLLYDYLVGSPDDIMILQPGERRYIYDSGIAWKKETCISGLMDITTTGDITFTIAAVSAGNTINNMSDMELFLKVVHPRGTFEGIAINYNINLDGTEPSKLILGSGDEEWLKGYDALTQEFSQNKGNYGVSYYITITATEDMGIILNPRANVFRGAIKWQGSDVYNIPASGTIFSNTAKAVSLGTIKSGETKTFEYMLPNGSSAPVLIGFIPKSYWNS